ncbi:MAG: rhodanese-like domain-containing protein [Desulfobacteraceae bacterium]
MEQVLKQLTLEFFGKGKHKISPENFFDLEKGFLLDVRSREEAGSVMIEMGFHTHLECKNIPVNEIPDRIKEIPGDKPIAVFCPANVRSAVVYAYLMSKGFTDVRILEGGYSALTDAVKPGKILKAVEKNRG